MKARYLSRVVDLSHEDDEKEGENHTDQQEAQEKNDSAKDDDNDDDTKNNKSKNKKKTKKNKKRQLNPPSVVETTSDEKSPPPTLDAEEEDEDSSSSSGRPATALKKERRRSPMRYFVYALLLWILEFGTVIVLKRFGISLEFDENVVQTVFEQQISRFTNESMMPAALSYLTQQTKRPGFQLAQEGASHLYPVVLVHGFVTSGLELWAGKECARQHFRQRFWAAMYGARSMLTDRDCWVEHMKLNPLTGVDPPGIRLRAASGFEAVDFFMANYWVFAKMIENLADLGYSPSDMGVEPYDWRLGFKALEERDGYFTSLKHRIEGLHKTNGRKVVLTSHSMGALVIHHFFAWVTTEESEGGGGGGADWLDKHVHAYLNIAGSHLGVPKAVTSLLSGDLSDFVMNVNNPVSNIIEGFFGRRLRRELWNTWGSVWMMLPKGPTSIWGTGADMCRNRTTETGVNLNETSVDIFCRQGEESPMLVMSDVHNETAQAANNTPGANLTLAITPDLLRRQSHTTQQSIDYVKAHGGGHGGNMSNSVDYSYHDQDGPPNEKPNPRFWHDPTRTPLPHAPNMKIYCLYGVGLETERAYYYRRNVVNDGNHSILEEPLIVLDPSVQQPENDIHLGIRYTDGDGSVPLVSLGYLCADAWQRESSGLNPSNIEVVTREYKHKSEFLVDDPVRGGRKSADHVDILGNADMMADILRVVSDFEVEKVNENHIVSDIEKIAEEINQRGGIFQKKRSPSRNWFGFKK